MAEYISFRDQLQNLSLKLIKGSEILTNLRLEKIEDIEKIENALQPVFLQIKELTKNKEKLSPFDALKAKEITLLEARKKNIETLLKGKRQETTENIALEETFAKVNEWNKSSFAAINREDVGASFSSLSSSQQVIEQLSKGKVGGRNVKISDLQKEKIKQLDAQCLEAARAHKNLRYKLALEGATQILGSRSQYDFDRGVINGNNICCCAAYRALVAMLKGTIGQIGNIDAILESGFKNYISLMYQLKNNPDNPEADRYKYGENLSYLDAKPSALELDSNFPELSQYNKSYRQALHSFPIGSQDLFSDVLKAISNDIPQGQDKITRKIKIGDQYFNIILRKDPRGERAENTYTTEIFECNKVDGGTNFFYRFESKPESTRKDPVIAYFEGKLGGLRTGNIEIYPCDLFTQQFLVSGQEQELYHGMLTALFNFMKGANKKQMGALFLSGIEFYSLVLRENDDGSCGVDFFDSHGTYDGPLKDKAYCVQFPTIAKLAEFLSIRKPHSPDSRGHASFNREMNECSLYPMMFNGGEFPNYFDLNPLPEKEQKGVLFEGGLKAVKDNSRNQNGKKWNVEKFFSVLKIEFPAHYKALSSDIAKTCNVPEAEEYLWEQLKPEWNKLPKSRQIQLVQSYISRCIKPEETTQKMDSVSEECKGVMNRLNGASSLNDVEQIQKTIKKIYNSIIDLIKAKIHGALTQEAEQKLIELQASYDTICTSYNRSIMPLRMDEAITTMETFLSDLGKGFKTDQDAPKVYSKLGDVLKISFEDDGTFTEVEKGKKQKIEELKKEASKQYHHHLFAYELHQVQVKYGNLLLEITNEEIKSTKQAKDLRKLLLETNSDFQNYCNKPDRRDQFDDDNKALIKTINENIELIITTFNTKFGKPK